MENKRDYDVRLKKARQLKMQIIAVIAIIAVTLTSGTVLAAVMLDFDSAPSIKFREKLSSMQEGPEYDCIIICPKCKKQHAYTYEPKNISAYYCTECDTCLEHGEIQYPKAQ